MRSTLALLLPVASAMRAYTAPSSLRALVDANDACDFPDEYVIQDFVGKSNSTDGVLASYNFTFIDQTTTTTSLCHFNSTSVSTTPGGLTPRYACEDRDVQFIWEDDEKDLTMIQRVCPGADGYELFPLCLSLTDDVKDLRLRSLRKPQPRWALMQPSWPVYN